MKLLREGECTLGQGYLIGMPMHAEQLAEWRQNRLEEQEALLV